MAWTVEDNEISMCEGDYGIDLPITVTGAEFTDADSLMITIKDAMNGNTLLEKSFTKALSLSAEDTASLPVGKYVYSLDWYQNNVFLCNIIPKAPFRVVDKV